MPRFKTFDVENKVNNILTSKSSPFGTDCLQNRLKKDVGRRGSTSLSLIEVTVFYAVFMSTNWLSSEIRFF